MNAQNPLAFLENYKAVKARLNPPIVNRVVLRPLPRPPVRGAQSRKCYREPIGPVIHRRADVVGRRCYYRPIGPEKPRDVISIASIPVVDMKMPRMPLEAILHEVAAKYGVSILDLRSRRRTHNLTVPRFEYCYRARHETMQSLPAIGRVLGGKDHSSVIHGIRRFTEMLESGEVCL